ncbi:hypothetical protein FEM48_Zijuj06G0030500 [Ziziphus jujuba var. spinosa]|uniref:EF-hand domain-containing protein n=1 Tax=Ziziphus jujuba var. spinosa TaxID=714518 RepID=A0A978V6S8_ZIZJJ|nr:hypothetical protein FEM48_Zijuj06G0030500 [Ziziphus jujuba var. spinosa]
MKAIDVNKDGMLSKEELKRAFEELGSRYPAWRAGRALSRADANNDGHISLDEIKELVAYVERPISKKSGNITDEQLKTIFLQHDVDNDGRLSREELTKAFKFLGSSFPGWRAIRCLRHVDSNGDGVINLDEVAQVVAYAKKFT